MTQIITAAQLSSVSSPLPSEFRLFSLGQNETSKGTFVLDQAGLDSIMAAYREAGVDLAIDYEHQTFLATDNGRPAPAAGWFAPAARADGIWATNVRWTDNAAEMLRKKEYRYFSPTFEVDENNRITRLLPIGLTNFPASKEQQALVAAKQGDEKTPNPKKGSIDLFAILNEQENKSMDKGLVTVIGLKDDADASQVEHRVMALVENEKRLLDITGKPSAGDALGAVIAMKDSDAELQKARKALRDWEARDEREKAEAAKKQINSLVESAVVEGRVSLKDTDRLNQLVRHGEQFGIEALKTVIDMLAPRPVRLYQAPPPANTVKEQFAAIEDYKKTHPNASTADAYIALSAERPALFAKEVA